MSAATKNERELHIFPRTSSTNATPSSIHFQRLPQDVGPMFRLQSQYHRQKSTSSAGMGRRNLRGRREHTLFHLFMHADSLYGSNVIRRGFGRDQRAGAKPRNYLAGSELRRSNSPAPHRMEKLFSIAVPDVPSLRLGGFWYWQPPGRVWRTKQLFAVPSARLLLWFDRAPWRFALPSSPYVPLVSRLFFLPCRRDDS